ncbi:uncharacterized protein METZ01_LOCUS38808 [marine metagenome]|uniref:Uncharacterized protein n=1 Tax=marine metagenome TaxID=408172 RepID=A0A381R402_9ZZZZ
MEVLDSIPSPDLTEQSRKALLLE